MDSEACYSRLVQENKSEKKTKYNLGVIYGTISKAKSQGLTASKYADQANNDYLKNISRIYTKYEEELEKNNMVVGT